MHNRGTAVALAITGLLAGAQPAGTERLALPIVQPEIRLSRRAIARSQSDVIRWGYFKNTGWTNRRYQRHAAKLANKARHRRACRGRG